MFWSQREVLLGWEMPQGVDHSPSALRAGPDQDLVTSLVSSTSWPQVSIKVTKETINLTFDILLPICW